MINLYENLSEFSYGYGVTREIEALLSGIGLHPTPFLPSLIHEEHLGFDVAFSDAGAIVLLQFKLGQQLGRFRRAYPHQPIPLLARPFFRFGIDAAGHQFRRLRAFERLGAEVYYVAPRFSDWTEYQRFFQTSTVLENSLLLAPSEIDSALAGSSGKHRIVYDASRRYVCSEPRALRETTRSEFIERVSIDVRQSKITLGQRFRDIIEPPTAELDIWPVLGRSRADFEARAKRPEDALAALVGADAWSQGIQMIIVTEN
jgi:hypothetical protein